MKNCLIRKILLFSYTVCLTLFTFALTHADVVTIPIAASSDDVEEMDVNGNMLLISKTLELVDDKGKHQTIGLRFPAIAIPPGAIVLNAYIEFTSTARNNAPASFTFYTEASDNSTSFLKDRYDLTSRPLSSSSVNWSSVSQWQMDGIYQSPDMSTIIQEILDRPGWITNNALSFIITGTGQRSAYSFEESAALAPRLVIEFTPVPDFVMLKSVQVINDPINGSSNPKAIPGSEHLYTITITNYGTGPADLNSVFTTDPIPANAALYVGDLNGSGPIDFQDGAVSCGLSYNFTNINSTLDDLEFSNNNGISFDYIPSPNGFGFDPAVTHFRINPKGIFNASVNGSNPSYTIMFKIKVI